jgi:hypothetical protein
VPVPECRVAPCIRARCLPGHSFQGSARWSFLYVSGAAATPPLPALQLEAGCRLRSRTTRSGRGASAAPKSRQSDLSAGRRSSMPVWHAVTVPRVNIVAAELGRPAGSPRTDEVRFIVDGLDLYDFPCLKRDAWVGPPRSVICPASEASTAGQIGGKAPRALLRGRPSCHSWLDVPPPGMSPSLSRRALAVPFRRWI